MNADNHLIDNLQTPLNERLTIEEKDKRKKHQEYLESHNCENHGQRINTQSWAMQASIEAVLNPARSILRQQNEG